MEFVNEGVFVLANVPSPPIPTKIDYFTAVEPAQFETGRGFRPDLEIMDVPDCRTIGSAEALMAKARDIGQRWMKGVSGERAWQILKSQIE